jgi:hypothetical protein
MSRIRSVLSCFVALALCVSPLALAEGSDSWDHSYGDGDHDWDHDGSDPECADHDSGPGHSAHVTQKLATKFGVDESHIASLRNENLGYGEIDHTLTLAERLPGGITTENVDQILYMRQEQGMGWGQIAKAQDTTLGRARQEYPTQPPVEPEPTPVDATAQATTGRTSTAQPKSLSRAGKSSYAVAGNSGSAKGHAAKSAMSRGGSSNRSFRPAAATSSPARSGGHAYGRGSSGGGSVGKASGKSNGKGKGLK